MRKLLLLLIAAASVAGVSGCRSLWSPGYRTSLQADPFSQPFGPGQQFSNDAAGPADNAGYTRIGPQPFNQPVAAPTHEVRRAVVDPATKSQSVPDPPYAAWTPEAREATDTRKPSSGIQQASFEQVEEDASCENAESQCCSESCNNPFARFEQPKPETSPALPEPDPISTVSFVTPDTAEPNPFEAPEASHDVPVTEFTGPEPDEVPITADPAFASEQPFYDDKPTVDDRGFPTGANNVHPTTADPGIPQALLERLKQNNTPNADTQQTAPPQHQPQSAAVAPAARGMSESFSNESHGWKPIRQTVKSTAPLMD